MAISHLCPTCGLDLARTRARRDPSLGLPIVLCPACATASARRRHPLIVMWRRGLRIRRSFWSLVGQFALLAILLLSVGRSSQTIARWTTEGATTLPALVLGAFRIDQGPGVATHPDALSAVTLWLGASAVAGVWLGATLPHWRTLTPLLVWIPLVGLASSTDAVGWLLWTPLARAAGRHDAYWGPSATEGIVLVQATLIACVITALTLPLGWLARRFFRAYSRRLWRKGLARARLARGGE